MASLVSTERAETNRGRQSSAKHNLGALIRGLWSSWLVIAGFAALATAASMLIDADCSAALRSLDLPGDLRKAINLSEAFAHGFGAAAILGTLLVTTTRRKAIWTAVMITVFSGVAANLSKAGIVRIRPHSVGSITVAQEPKVDTQNPSIVQASFWDARQRSFPSGHAATAVGLAIGLSLAFPRASALFGLFACLACIQRITSGAHFPSDILAGVTIAFVSAAVVVASTRHWEFRRRAANDDCGCAHPPGSVPSTST